MADPFPFRVSHCTPSFLSMPVLQPHSELPSLPHIYRDDIRSRVFTHRSYFGRPANVFEDPIEDLSPDNEKLEHLGDAVLGFVTTSLIMETYPGLRVGPCTKVRSLIVANTNLADISLKYKLPENLIVHPAQADALRVSPKVQADLFESFIGGLYLDQGLETVQTWLFALLRPYARVAYQSVRREHGLVTPPDSPTVPTSSPTSPLLQPLTPSEVSGYLSRFNEHLQKTNRRVEWTYSARDPFGVDLSSGSGGKATPMWLAQAIVDGQVYGRGLGNTKKAARNETAKQSLALLGVVSL